MGEFRDQKDVSLAVASVETPQAAGELLKRELLGALRADPQADPQADPGAIADLRRLLLIASGTSLVDGLESAAGLLALCGDVESAGHLWLIADDRRRRRRSPKSDAALQDHNLKRQSDKLRKIRFIESKGRAIRASERGREYSDSRLATEIARAAKAEGIEGLSKHRVRSLLKGLGLSRTK